MWQIFSGNPRHASLRISTRVTSTPRLPSSNQLISSRVRRQGRAGLNRHLSVMGKGQLRLLTVVALQLSAAASRRDGDAAAAAAPDGHCDGDDCGSDLAAGAATDLVDEIPPLQLDDLDLDGFRESVSRGKWFIKFYAPWCKHCQVGTPSNSSHTTHSGHPLHKKAHHNSQPTQALAPHWRDLAVKLHAGPDDVNVGKLDCTKAEDVCAAELVKGYPTLRFYEGDFHKDYRGVRALPAIETFINRALKPTTTAIASLEDLADAQRANQVIFVSFSARSSVIDPNSEVTNTPSPPPPPPP